MSQGAQFQDIRPRDPRRGFVDRTPRPLNFGGARQLLIPPGAIQPGQQLYLILEFEVPAPSMSAILLQPWFLRPQTQYRSPGFNWLRPPPDPIRYGQEDYASTIYQTGVETGADGLSFGTPADDATPEGRLANWLAHDPLWLAAPKILSALPGELVNGVPVPSGYTLSSHLDDVWRIQLTHTRRIAMWYPSHGNALAVSAQLEGVIAEPPPLIFNWKAGVMTAIHQEGVD